MKRIVLISALALITVSASAGEQQTRFYTPDGRSAGTAVPIGQGSVRYFDARGSRRARPSALARSTNRGDSARLIGRDAQED
jgi:hypothetical protein